LPAFKTHHMPK